MGTLQWFLFVYLLGGVTFVPLLIAAVLLHAYYTLPAPRPDVPNPDDPAQLADPHDDKSAFKTATDDLAEQFHRKHDSDVAAGYFAVCRQYVPGGVNGKPPDKLTPAGEVVAQESPSVYQSMYRSIFDRSQKPTLEPNKDANGKTVKKANNVFYVVLRHGHLMLYDDIQQLEVRYVISLEHHDVDIYSGEDETPEGELWIKRNAIRLQRKKTAAGDILGSPPFYLFGENLSEKEDFYFALLKNQENSAGDDPPEPLHFEVDDMVKLVQKLHSSEEHLQTRWLNAVIGRWFLAMYKTPELEAIIRKKLTKKISRVKKPNFVTKLALKKIDPGSGAPFVTNPRLKDLTVDGDCMVEADVNYSGNFLIEIAATARIELGSRFKPREVDMVLAVTCKKLQGHILVRFKPPPSNRIWFSFEKMPELDLALEPIVSSRQITYNFILRAIESRIREVVAESICLPFWDDIAFLDTRGQRYRGGIWKREPTLATTTEIPDEDPEDEAEAGETGTRTPADLDDGGLSKDDRIMSMPVLADSKPAAGKTKASKKSISSLNDLLSTRGSEAGERPESATPRLMRSPSFASAANPTVSPSHVDANTSPTREGNSRSTRESVANILKDLSARSTGSPSPSTSQAGSPPMESTMATSMRGQERSQSDVSRWSDDGSTPADPTNTQSSRASTRSSETSDWKGGRPGSAHEKPKSSKASTFSSKSLTSSDRKQALASVNAAAAAAQKWGWGVLARNRQREAQGAGGDKERNGHGHGSPREPMGRGRPLPPPGTPLPPPELPNRTGSFMMPRRKPVPPPVLPKRQGTGTSGSSGTGKPAVVKPALPARRKRQNTLQPGEEDTESEVLVVEAPSESAPASPVAGPGEHDDEFFGHGEDVDATETGDEPGGEKGLVVADETREKRPVPPPLPLRRGKGGDLVSGTPEEAKDELS